MSRGQLEGQTAVITGASDGIGLASACSLARDGAAVVIMARGEEALARARSSILAESPGARVEMVVGDACDEAAVKDALARAHASTGRLDMVIATVGGADFKPLLLRELADVREEMDRNFTSAFLMARHGAPLMHNGGAIVCISTAAVVQSYWGLSIYAAAKAAVERFVRSAALELGGAGIRINAVRPGSTFPTERSEAPEFREIVDYYAGQTPLGRIGRPEDIARVVRFLAGPDSGWVTGQTFSADGGQDQCTAPELMEPLYGKAVMDQIRAGRIPNPA
ncbi:MAG TPA: SDR family oxidoreductase [Sphingobium sp.]|uniref:SDR family NAD(P)-dependent oxidoreductase n=1 Tax=Sphingobium sp. TaxID=1912891 RepID=UPI002ED4D37C